MLPDFFQVEIELFAKGEYKPGSYKAARKGLEGVLYVMDNTVVAEVLGDLDQRLNFLTNLDAMLEPFRKLKESDPLDLGKTFEFGATGRGKRAQEQMNETLNDWGVPCFDLHLLCLDGVRIEPAKKRVAAVHGKTGDALGKNYKQWSQHTVRKEVNRRGDDHAREFLSSPDCQALLTTAFPVLRADPRPHRPA